MASHETIYVTEGAGGSLLSWRTSQKLDLISIITPLTINNKTKVEQVVQETFQRLRENGLTLHRDKCIFSQKLEFFGHVLSGKGISADPNKIEAIINLQALSNAKGVRSLLNMSMAMQPWFSPYTR